MVKNLSRLWGFALLVAWGVDTLFWEKTPGISFAVFVAACLLVGFALAYGEGLRPARASLLLLLPLGFFAAMSAVRQEAFTRGLDYLFSLGLLALLAASFLGGRWPFYRVVDYLVAAFQLILSAIARLGMAWSAQRKVAKENDSDPGRVPAWVHAGPALRGLLLALPVVILFSGLLASADLVFSQRLEEFLKLIRIENLGEYLFRLFYILVLSWAFAGIYLYALTASRDEQVTANDRPSLLPFLGFTEAIVVLGSVNLLFAFFVGIQFRYFFGGQANIHRLGYTYSEYARRGFGELVLVACLSLLLYLGLVAIAKRANPAQRWVFSAMGIALLALIAVMLASAFQRLALYERAYGFTGLRTYTHIFMIWLGILLLVVVGLEIAGRQRFFPLAALLAALGFGVTLNLIDVEAFIVRQNVARVQAAYPLDSAYLGRLSSDATPALAQAYLGAGLPAGLPAADRDELGAILACRAARLAEQGRLPWQAFTASRYREEGVLRGLREALRLYPVRKDAYGQWLVWVNGEGRYCDPGHVD